MKRVLIVALSLIASSALAQPAFPPGVNYPIGTFASYNNFYVSSTSGTDTNNNCAVLATPCATIGRALSMAALSPSAISTTTTINIGDGVHQETYNESFAISGLRSPGSISIVRSTQPEIIFSGSGSTLTTIAGDGVSIFDFLANKDATVGIQNMTLTATAVAGQEELYAQLGGTIFVLGTDIVFGTSTSGHQIFCENVGSGIEIWGNYTITGGATRHIGVSQGCYVHYNVPTIVVTIKNTPTFTTAFIVANTAGGVQLNYNAQFVGPVNAVPFIIQSNGWIENSSFNGSGNTNYTWPASVLTAASWSGSKVTFTTTNAAHNVPVGGTFTTSGNTPAGYNGTFLAITGTTGNTIVAAMAANPGANTILGTLAAGATGYIPGNVVGVIGSGGRFHTDYAACIGTNTGCANEHGPTGLGTGGTAQVSGTARSGAITLHTGTDTTAASGLVYVYPGESLQRVGAGYGPCTVTVASGVSTWLSTSYAFVSGQSPSTPPYDVFGWNTNGAVLTANSTYIINYVCDGDF